MTTTTDHRCTKHPGHENHCASGVCGACWLCKERWVPPTAPDYESVRILRLQPGDTVVVRLAYDYPRDVIEAVHDDVGPKFPGNEVLILGPSVDLEIIRAGHEDDDPTVEQPRLYEPRHATDGCGWWICAKCRILFNRHGRALANPK